MWCLFYNRLMPRITRLEKNQVDSETGKIYDSYLKERGNVPNMFRTVAHRPEIFRTMIAHFRAVMNTGTLSAKLKELVIVRTSQINHCEY
jgi:alkylhydroperoxidase family enzyme